MTTEAKLERATEIVRDFHPERGAVAVRAIHAATAREGIGQAITSRAITEVVRAGGLRRVRNGNAYWLEPTPPKAKPQRMKLCRCPHPFISDPELGLCFWCSRPVGGTLDKSDAEDEKWRETLRQSSARNGNGK